MVAIEPRAEALSQRKVDHLDLAIKGPVAFRRVSTLLADVRLIHNCLPELSMDELDTSLELLGKRLSAPIVIAGMTGGTERAADVNRSLAAVAEARGYAFGVGSQRAILKDRRLARSYHVRDAAPGVLLLGNIGIVQAAAMSTAEVAELADCIGADAMCIHMNPAMEAVQCDGDRDFRGGAATFERLARDLPVPVIAKETGCGISRGAAARLRQAGVRFVDVSGAGGTSWVGVETLRAQPGDRQLGEAFWDWGIPTAAAVACAASAGFEGVLATGGLSSGMDVARALVLGASAAGIARPVLQRFATDGSAGVEQYLAGVERELRMTMLLCGAKDLQALRRADHFLTGELEAWVRGCGLSQGDRT